MNPVLSEDRLGGLRIWDHPCDGREYVAGADPSEGRKRDRSAMERKRLYNYASDRPDYSACVVLELETGLHVATWHGYLTPDLFAEVVAAIGYYYNTALLVPEVNGPGLALVTILSERIKYSNMYRTRMFNVLERDPFAPQLGWQTNKHSRKLLIARIHEVINSNVQFTRDRELIAELRTMEFDDEGTERGRGKNKDDRAMALGMALQGRYEAIGGLAERQAPKKANRAYNDAIWNKVQEKIEKQQEMADVRRSSGGRVFLGRPRVLRPGVGS